jgi:hypothetical protein
MKVTGPGSGLPPGATGEAESAGKAVPGGEAKGVSGAGGAFADKLDQPGGAAAVAEPAAARGAPAVADLGADLQAGKITAEVALERAIGRILDVQVGAHAPAAVRAQVEAALRDALASDPLLVEKVKQLSAE